MGSSMALLYASYTGNVIPLARLQVMARLPHLPGHKRWCRAGGRCRHGLWGLPPRILNGILYRYGRACGCPDSSGVADISRTVWSAQYFAFRHEAAAQTWCLRRPGGLGSPPPSGIFHVRSGKRTFVPTLSAGGASPHSSPGCYCGRRKHRIFASFSLRPPRRSDGYAFGVLRSEARESPALSTASLRDLVRKAG